MLVLRIFLKVWNKFWGATQNTGAFTWYSSYQFSNEGPQFKKGTITLIR